MSKVLPALLGTVLIIGMSAFSVYQFNTIKKEKISNKHLQKENQFLEESLELETQQNIVLSDDNIILRDKLEELRDSMVLLQSELTYLKKKVKTQSKKATAKKKRC